MRRWVLVENADATWTLMAEHTGAIHVHPIAATLLSVVLGEITAEPPVVAVAHWLAGEVEGMHAELVAERCAS